MGLHDQLLSLIEVNTRDLESDLDYMSLDPPDPVGSSENYGHT